MEIIITDKEIECRGDDCPLCKRGILAQEHYKIPVWDKSEDYYAGKPPDRYFVASSDLTERLKRTVKHTATQ